MESLTRDLEVGERFFMPRPLPQAGQWPVSPRLIAPIAVIAVIIVALLPAYM